MNKFLVVVACLTVLSGCGMSIDEYESRLAYCKSKNADTVDIEKDKHNRPYYITCIKDSFKFPSEVQNER